MTLNCPRTGKPLRPVKIGGVTVDFSDACGGVFFDRFEIQRFDDDIEFAGDVLAELMEKHEDPLIDFTARLRCPKHPAVVMMRRFYSPKRGVEIDECPECGGIWMDAGELAEARRELPNQAERERAGQALVKEVMDSGAALHKRGATGFKTKPETISKALSGILGVPRK